MEENDFLWLQKWYYHYCDGDWEHDRRIHIETIDNPGWTFTADLKDTNIENKKFQEIEINRTENNWIFCSIRNNKFEGRCGPINLSEILKIFRAWAEDHHQ